MPEKQCKAQGSLLGNACIWKGTCLFRSWTLMHNASGRAMGLLRSSMPRIWEAQNKGKFVSLSAGLVQKERGLPHEKRAKQWCNATVFNPH